MLSCVANSWVGAYEGRLHQGSKYLLGEKPCFKQKTESETDILHAFLWVTAWSGIHLNQILLLLCLCCGRTHQKGLRVIHTLQALRTAWRGFRQNTLKNIPQLCVLCSKKPQSPFFPPPPYHQRQHARRVGLGLLRFESQELCLQTVRAWACFLLSKSRFHYL